MVWSAAVNTLARAKAMPQNQQVRTGQGVVVSGGRRFGHEPVDVRTFASRADCIYVSPAYVDTSHNCRKTCRTAHWTIDKSSTYYHAYEVKLLQLVVLPFLSESVSFVLVVMVQEQE